MLRLSAVSCPIQFAYALSLSLADQTAIEIAFSDFVLISDARAFFAECLNEQSKIEYQHVQLKTLHDRCESILSSFGTRTQLTSDEEIRIRELFSDGDSSSYLIMNIPRPHLGDGADADAVEGSRALLRKYSFTDDENFYDNYNVENSNTKKEAKSPPAKPSKVGKARAKRDCPFRGLPVAHLNITKSRKVGWLTISCRRRTFLNILSNYFNRRYYVGLLSDENFESEEKSYWLLLYGDDTKQLQPSANIDLKSFEIGELRSKSKAQNKPSVLRFSLRERNSCNKQATMVYTLNADSNEETERWRATLILISEELNRSSSSTINRELPQLPLDSSASRMRQAAEQAMYCNEDAPNFSEGVYEEPELLNKCSAECQDNTDPSLLYDVPKTPARRLPPTQSSPMPSISGALAAKPTASECVETKRRASASANVTVGNEDDYDNIVVSREATGVSKMHEARTKLTKHFKERGQSGPFAHREGPPEAKDKHETIGTMKKIVARIRRSSVLSLRSPKSLKRNKKDLKAPQAPVDEVSDENCPEERDEVKQKPNQSKVHMIINQLEANGKLTLLNGGAVSAANQRTSAK